MNILILNSYHSPINEYVVYDGISKFVRDSAIALSKKYNVSILTTSDSDNFLSRKNLTIKKLSFYSKKRYGEKKEKFPRIITNKYYFELDELLKKQKYDIIINNVANSTMVKYLSYLKIPTINIVHNSGNFGFTSKNYAEATRDAHKKNDKNISLTVSQYALDIYIKKSYIESFHGHIHAAIFEKKPKIMNSEDITTVINRFDINKNMKLTLEVMKYLNKDSYVFGKYSSHMKVDDIYKLKIDELLKSSNIKYYINLPHLEIMNIVSKSKLHFFLNKYESFGIVASEANLLGVPIIGFNRGFIHESSLDPILIPIEIESSKKKIIPYIKDVYENLDFDYKDRCDLSNKTYEKFSEESWLKKFEYILDEWKLK